MVKMIKIKNSSKLSKKEKEYIKKELEKIQEDINFYNIELKHLKYSGDKEYISKYRKKLTQARQSEDLYLDLLY